MLDPAELSGGVESMRVITEIIQGRLGSDHLVPSLS